MGEANELGSIESFVFICDSDDSREKPPGDWVVDKFREKSPAYDTETGSQA
jgi:hypothetical protein